MVVRVRVRARARVRVRVRVRVTIGVPRIFEAADRFFAASSGESSEVTPPCLFNDASPSGVGV